MSKIENYNKTSENYDSVRVAAGYDIIAGMVPYYCGKPLSELHILDAGCGTGNYAKALLDCGLGHVTLLDASNGMLGKSRAKLADEISSGKVTSVTEARMPPLPHSDDSFDAVMFNMVLHHLQENPDGEHFPAIEAVLLEARRVLKKGGVLSITTGFPRKYLPLVWFAILNENISERYVKYYPEVRHWLDMLKKCGLKLLTKLDSAMPVDEKGLKGFLDPLGPTRKEWRDVNSYWGSATPDEIAEIENKVLEMHKNGTLEDFARENTKIDGMFSYTFIFATPI